MWITLPAALTLVALGALSGPAAAREPLVMEDKERLYQRVLVRTRTSAMSAPGGTEIATLRPLQPLYVFARDGDWLEVGADVDGGETGWVPSADTVPWRQTIVATFEGSENVGRVLFFADEDAIFDVVESEDPAIAADEARTEARAAEQGGAPSDTVVALGPRETVDLRSNLYVMPILDAEEAIFENGAFVNVLKVAVARAEVGGVPQIDAPIDPPQGVRDNFKAAVVFVVDTTISMQPYINATRAALTDIYDRIAGSAAGDAVSFGLIGYRDNLAAAPGLGYDVDTFVTLQDGFSSESFLAGIDEMTEAQTSSRHFREDSYAGISHALRDLDWNGFGARFLVLVTDAGPREFDDEFSATGLSAAGLANLVEAQLGGALAAMHLRTDAGSTDHARAEDAYRALTSAPNRPPLYFPVDGGDPAAYRAEAARLAQAITDQVAAFRDGADPEDFADPGTGGGLSAALLSAGRTMQLAYLGRREGTKAPDVFEAFVADRDFDRTGLKPLSIRLLLNKRQLSDLDQALRIIIDEAETNIISPDQFFAQVLGTAADMSRSPDEVARQADTSLAEAVFIDEYLEGLPYRSRIMTITEDDWIRLSISEQQDVVNDLYDKVTRYARYNEATDQWVDYLGTGGADALLYPMRLDDLP